MFISFDKFTESSTNSLLFNILSYRQTAAVSHQQQLLLLLPSLRQADNILRKFWIEIYREGNVNMKKLFVEMLESVTK